MNLSFELARESGLFLLCFAHYLVPLCPFVMPFSREYRDWHRLEVEVTTFEALEKNTAVNGA